MARLTIDEIRRFAEAAGHADASEFLEITFTTGQDHSVVDEKWRNVTISTDCDYGIVLIDFDDFGLLRSIQIT